MDQSKMLEIVEQYTRQTTPEIGEIKVIRLPDRKTVFVEQSGDSGRSIILTEYKIDGKFYWAGYSPRSQIVYVSFGP